MLYTIGGITLVALAVWCIGWCGVWLLIGWVSLTDSIEKCFKRKQP